MYSSPRNSILRRCITFVTISLMFSPCKASTFVSARRFCQYRAADLIIAIPIYLFSSSSDILFTLSANRSDVSHLSKVDDIFGLQSRSKYIPNGFIPSGLNLSIGESNSCFTDSWT